MYNYKFVTAKQSSNVKNELISILLSMQDLISDEMTFQFNFTGSAVRNMITYDPQANAGFDFDVNIHVNKAMNRFTAKEIKLKFKDVLDQSALSFGYDYAENSTRVLTIKLKDRQHSKIVHSCDFAIVYDYIDNNGKTRQKYIHYNKKQDIYAWKDQSDGYYLLPKKTEWIKVHKHWPQVRDLYLKKKNLNQAPKKKSEAIYAETIHEICQKYGYYKGIL